MCERERDVQKKQALASWKLQKGQKEDYSYAAHGKNRPANGTGKNSGNTIKSAKKLSGCFHFFKKKNFVQH